ncbi:MAG: phosphoribosyltransferase [Candidatus Woesearchaeota archaeon]
MLLSNLEYGSLFAYCPRFIEGQKNEEIKKSKNVMNNVKSDSIRGNPPRVTSELISEMIKTKIESFPFKDFFGEDIDLVPVPKSHLMQKDTLWVPDRIARALSKQGLGNYYPCLQRFIPVQKSSYSVSSERPKPTEHYNSIKVIPQVHQPRSILLIDDVITRGSTMQGCASLLKKHFPNIPIKGFALIRTISNPHEFAKYNDSCIGVISLVNEESFRTP